MGIVLRINPVPSGGIVFLTLFFFFPKVFFHLFRLSFNFSQQHLVVLIFNYYSSMVKFIPKWFLLLMKVGQFS